jgi:hypothetical protein
MKFRRFVIVAVLLCGVRVWQGCAVLLVGAAAGGTVSYIGNELRTIQEVNIDKAWTVAQGTVTELGFTIDASRSRKDGTGAVLYSQKTNQQRVLIVLIRMSDRLTEIRVTVGVFDTDANRREAQLIYDKMRISM